MISVRSYLHSDIAEIITLEQTIYPSKSFDRNRLLWKYMEHCHGSPILMVAETTDKNIVGLRGLLPRKLNFDGKIRLMYQAVDTGVHPAYRHQGLFTQMTNKSLEIAEEYNAYSIFNFPNFSSLHGYLKLGWKCIHRLHWWVRPIPSVVFWRQAEPIDYDNMNLASSSKSPRLIPNFVRDEEYLRWRYENPPDRHYQFWELGPYHGNDLYAVTTNLTRKRIAQSILVDIIGGGFMESDVPSILNTIVNKVTKLGIPLSILEGTLGYSTKHLIMRGFVRVPYVGVNFVIKDISHGERIPFSKTQICPGDMDTF